MRVFLYILFDNESSTIKLLHRYNFQELHIKFLLYIANEGYGSKFK